MTPHDLPDVTVMFDSANYAVAEGGGVMVSLRLSADPKRTVMIPITTTNQAGAGGDDYHGVPAALAFRGVAEQAFTLTATRDSISDDGESVLIGLGALPSGVSSSAPAQTQVDITDVAPTVVNFEQDSYTVAEGDSVTVRVRLDSPAHDQIDPLPQPGRAARAAPTTPSRPGP